MSECGARLATTEINETIEAIRREFCLAGYVVEVPASEVEIRSAAFARMISAAQQVAAEGGVPIVLILHAISNHENCRAFVDQHGGSLVWMAEVDGCEHYIQIPAGEWKMSE